MRQFYILLSVYTLRFLWYIILKIVSRLCFWLYVYIFYAIKYLTTNSLHVRGKKIFIIHDTTSCEFFFPFILWQSHEVFWSEIISNLIKFKFIFKSNFSFIYSNIPYSINSNQNNVRRRRCVFNLALR